MTTYYAGTPPPCGYVYLSISVSKYLSNTVLIKSVKRKRQRVKSVKFTLIFYAFYPLHILLFTLFTNVLSGKNWARTSTDQLLKKINCTGVTERSKASDRPRSVHMSEFRKTSNLWRSLSADMKLFCTSTNPYEIDMDIDEYFYQITLK